MAENPQRRNRSVTCPMRYRDPNTTEQENKARMDETEQDRAVLAFANKRTTASPPRKAFLPATLDSDQPPRTRLKRAATATSLSLSLDLSSLPPQSPPEAHVSPQSKRPSSARGLLQEKQKRALGPIIQQQRILSGSQTARV